MIKIENVEVFNFEGAIRGMRNPLESHKKSDSKRVDAIECMNCTEYDCKRKCNFCIGKNDLKLMQNLYKAGTEHRKYARQIFVSMDIMAPLYWWKEFDTYKVGTTANSCSTMHKIHSREFTVDDFSYEHLIQSEPIPCTTFSAYQLAELIIKSLNMLRELYMDTGEKKYWWQLIQLLPSSYNQKRTVTMTYENVFSIIKQRTGHKLDEWNDFVKTLKELPYVEEIMEGKQ